MKLKVENLKCKEFWDSIDVKLPSYDVEEVCEKTRKNPTWVHFGCGNIFRVFLGGLADKLLNEKWSEKGIICAECFDMDVVDKIYKPYDNLALKIILNSDGTTEKTILGSLCEAVKAVPAEEKDWERLKTIFRSESLQMVSFTITEKGYALRNSEGVLFPFVKHDMENGPENVQSTMAIIAAMLLERYHAGKTPISMVSMDNCAKNGLRFRESVLEIATEWEKNGFVDHAFVEYVSDENVVAFPWTMIDKITPRPSEELANELEKAGLEDMQPVITSKRTYIAPFINAEQIQYLVIENNFPNGCPLKGMKDVGVYLTDRETVNKSERMKVTVCLNPIHSALGTYGCVLGYTAFAEQMRDPVCLKFANAVGAEGMDVVPDPEIISPEAFLEEVLVERFPNTYLGDTVQRLVTDISQGVGVRFGETVKSYVSKYGSAKQLKAIPFAIAGWIRYLLAVDDMGNPFELSPDPLNDVLQEQLAGVVVGDETSLGTKARKILSNVNIFGVDLFEAGIGEDIEEILRKEIRGKGAVRDTLNEYFG